MTVGCKRCPDGTTWRATGVFNAGLQVSRRAELRCDGCGRTFYSALPDALEAGEAARLAQPADVAPTTVAGESGDLFTPAPRLMTVAPRSQDTITLDQLAQHQRWRRVKYAQDRDRLARQTGRPPA